MKSKSKNKIVYVCGVNYQQELGYKRGYGPTKVFNSVADLKEHTSCWPGCGVVRVEIKDAKWVVPQDLLRDDSTLSVSKRKERKWAFEAKVKEYRHFLKQDEDYDWHFIIRSLRFKLERTRKHLAVGDRFAETKQITNEIQAVVDLLARIEANPYFKELRRPFWKKYGKPKLIFGKANERGRSIMTVRHPNETPRNRNQITRESVRLTKEEHRLRREDLKKAFKLMEKNIWKWWD